MAYAAARLNIIEGLVKVEATYGTDSAPVATADAVLLALPGNTADLIPDTYGFTGDNGPNSVGLQPRKYSAPAQRSGTAAFPCYFQGPGVAYSAVVTAVNGLHPIILGCGYTGAFSGGAGAEIWTYTPTADSVTPTSVTVYGFGRQMLGGSTFRKSALTGAMGSLKVAAPDLKPAVFTGDFKGIYPADPTEAAFTAPTLNAVVNPPNMAGAVLTIDGTALSMYNWSFDAGHDLSSDRVPQTAATGFLGIVAGGWMPKLKVQVEDSLLATYNPYTKRASAATAAVVLTFGTVQYNKMTLNLPTCQLTNVTEASKGSIGLFDLEFTAIPSTLAGNDSHTWVAS